MFYSTLTYPHNTRNTSDGNNPNNNESYFSNQLIGKHERSMQAFDLEIASPSTPPMDMESEIELAELDQEASMLREISLQLDAITGVYSDPDTAEDVDLKSVYVGNVDYGSTSIELGEHFELCGDVTRVTILSNKVTGHPKGFAYLEFSSVEEATQALAMDASAFRGRRLKVRPKRNNIYGYNAFFLRGYGRGHGSFGRRSRGRFGYQSRRFFRNCPYTSSSNILDMKE